MITRLDERGGSPAVEAAAAALVVGLLLAFGIAGGRLVTAEAAADHASRAAARIASLQRDANTAQVAATAAARESLAAQGLACESVTVTVDTSEFGRPLGAPASVQATVRCAVRWSDLGLPGVTSTREVVSEFTSPIDTMTERS